MARLYNFFKIQFYTFKLDVTFKYNYFLKFFFYDVNDSIFINAFYKFLFKNILFITKWNIF